MDNVRSIPCLMDGLKPGQRKVMFTCIKRNLTQKEIKVAQLAGSVAEQSAYHHGEVSWGLCPSRPGDPPLQSSSPCQLRSLNILPAIVVGYAVVFAMRILAQMLETGVGILVVVVLLLCVTKSLAWCCVCCIPAYIVTICYRWEASGGGGGGGCNSTLMSMSPCIMQPDYMYKIQATCDADL